MRRPLLSLSLVPLALALVACSPETQQRLESRLQTAAPTLKAAAGTQVAGAIASAAPSLEAAAQSAGTTVAAALGTAQPTLQAAGTQVAGALGTAGPTLEAAARSAGTQVAGALGTAGPTLEAAGKALAFAPAIGRRWAWQGTEGAGGAGGAPPDPGAYTVQFGPDGALSLRADCNTGSGSYALEGDKLTISVGAMTMAACPEGSLDSVFVGQLGQVSGFRFQPGSLALALGADEGSMTFAPAR